MYSIIFYVPESHLEKVKSSLFSKGAGHLGNYDCCCWQTLGVGQYRPLPDSQPYEGQEDEITRTLEYKVEMVCEEKSLQNVLDALLEAHPYETPTYAVYTINNIE